MGGVLRKPVAVNSWESLEAEARRLLDSSTRLLREGTTNQQMRAMFGQANMLSRIIHTFLLQNHRHPLAAERLEWHRQWFSQIEENYNTFKRQNSLRLEGIDELKESLL
jgi:hypothetical protein